MEELLREAIRDRDLAEEMYKICDPEQDTIFYHLWKAAEAKVSWILREAKK